MHRHHRRHHLHPDLIESITSASGHMPHTTCNHSTSCRLARHATCTLSSCLCITPPPSLVDLSTAPPPPNLGLRCRQVIGETWPIFNGPLNHGTISDATSPLRPRTTGGARIRLDIGPLCRPVSVLCYAAAVSVKGAGRKYRRLKAFSYSGVPKSPAGPSSRQALPELNLLDLASGSGLH